MQCPSCERQNRDDVTFCTGCGVKLKATCPTCGASYQSDDAFYGSCGQPLDGGTSRGPTAVNGLIAAPPGDCQRFGR